MSYIVDALKKSEQQRSRQGNSDPRDGSPQEGMDRVVESRAPGRAGFYVLGLVTLGISLGWFFFVPNDKKPLENTDVLQQTKPVPVVETTPDIPASRHKSIVTEETTDDQSTSAVPVKSEKAKVLSYRDLPFYWELPPALKKDVGGLAVTIHIYAPHVSQQILFINDREYHPGETIREGARVERIVAEGVILSINDTYFRLPRPR
ncbi:MAG: general secretion pathway protein GspB [Gammaproteobacteria bacterium]|nr:general secretion pathway protein GspB [Gammaproteobacteria bacterium]